MSDAVQQALRKYLLDIRQLPNEAAKSTRFSMLVSEIFPGSKAISEVAGGIEKRLLRIDTASGPKRGRVDLYYGNAIIEFENSLKATGDEAERQLCKYTAGTWAKEGKRRRPLLCIASDGIVWKTYAPRVKGGAEARVTAEAIELRPLREFTLTPDSLHGFWIWLTTLLFRPGQMEPTTERFRIDFGSTSQAFADALISLRSAWNLVSSTTEAMTAVQTWQKYLLYTYGQLASTTSGAASQTKRPGRRARDTGLPDEIEDLFLKHTYLVSVSRFLAWAALSAGRTTINLRETAAEILSGQFFRKERVENLVEDDFFHWVRQSRAEEVLAPVWERLLSLTCSYDLARLDQDILKGIYQELVDPQDRRDLGEYYTPEWLCQRIVSEMLPAQGMPSVLDPACGSGSFLRAAIVHLLKANPEGGAEKRLQRVLEHVVGIDIHPVAVTIARVTYLLAVRDLLKSVQRPVQIPVYLADSLFLPSEVVAPRFGEVPGYEIRFGVDRRVSIPEALVKAADLFDPAIAACAEVAVSQAKDKGESPKSLGAYLDRSVPGLAARSDFPVIQAALWKFTTELADLIVAQRDSIWAFIVRNAYRPAMLRERFDLLLGNPPWLSYRNIADPEYQAEIKRRAVEEYAIAPRSKKLMTQMELATVFLVHTLSTFGRSGARLAFVMPRSVLTADQHANLRDRSYSAPVRLDGYWDLREVEPVFNVPACVLFATRERVLESVTYTLPAREWAGRLSERDVSWPEAESSLTSNEKSATVARLGTHTAFTTEKSQKSSDQASPYAGRFRQGATIVPRSFYFVRVRDLDAAADHERLYSAETDPEQAAQAKAPYKDVRMEGEVEGRFIYATALAKHVLPFVMLPPATVVLPAEVVDGEIRIRTAKWLREQGYRGLARWMTQADRVWAEKRAGKAEHQSTYEWLDYGKKLSSQRIDHRHVVLYNAAGMNLSATKLDRTSLPLRFVVEHKLYWTACDTESEADYLAAVLNASVVNEWIKPFQSRGLMGERDIEKKVLDLPIPLYSSADGHHGLIADLGGRASAEAGEFRSRTPISSSLGRMRGAVREALAGTLEEIDAAVKRLLGR